MGARNLVSLTFCREHKGYAVKKTSLRGLSPGGPIHA